MIGLVAVMQIHSEKGEVMVDVLTRLRSAILSTEPGCLQYDFYRDRADPNRYVAIERYADQDALDVHGKGDAGSILLELKALLAAPSAIFRLDPVLV